MLSRFPGFFSFSARSGRLCLIASPTPNGNICESIKVMRTLTTSIWSGLLSGGRGGQEPEGERKQGAQEQRGHQRGRSRKEDHQPHRGGHVALRHPRERRAIRGAGANGGNQEPGSDVRVCVEQ